MDKDKLDRVINAFLMRCIMSLVSMRKVWWQILLGDLVDLVSSSPAAGPTAGYDSTLKLDGRNKFVRKAIKDLMDRQQKRKDRKAKKKALDFNPYFKPHGRSS